MAGASITINDANGNSATKTADGNGAYSFDVTSLTAPFVITATVQVGDTQLSLTSMVADKPADLKPKFGYGAGARWRSPVGPINLDLAYGHARKQVRLHFSLGFAF